MLKKQIWQFAFVYCLFFLITGCYSKIENNYRLINREPSIFPDYSGVTIPPNIAPLNFKINEIGKFFRIRVCDSSDSEILSFLSLNGGVKFPRRKWKKILNVYRGNQISVYIFSADYHNCFSNKYSPIKMYISDKEIDPYLTYRVIHPGYYSWYKMKIVQRCLENFNERSLIDNSLLDNNCINCHSFKQNDPGQFLVHFRGSKGGTYFVEKGQIKRRELKTENMPLGATYPSWHPGGKYIAFSSNQVNQSFYARFPEIIEVYDRISDLIFYDLEKNALCYISDNDLVRRIETFPHWSPDGKYLYYCSSLGIDQDINVESISKIHYDLMRRPFNQETAIFGEPEMVYYASGLNKSVSFPRVSPDGRYLVFTLHENGTFPIWHKEADLYLLDIENRKVHTMNINSDETESYHSWSANGKWLVFSSKRVDGRTTFPFIVYFESPEKIGKPFILPQKNPNFYNNMLKSFNIPEFVLGKIKFNPESFARASNQESTNAILKNEENIPHIKNIDNPPSGEIRIHE